MYASITTQAIDFNNCKVGSTTPQWDKTTCSCPRGPGFETQHPLPYGQGLYSKKKKERERRCKVNTTIYRK